MNYKGLTLFLAIGLLLALLACTPSHFVKVEFQTSENNLGTVFYKTIPAILRKNGFVLHEKIDELDFSGWSKGEDGKQWGLFDYKSINEKMKIRAILSTNPHQISKQKTVNVTVAFADMMHTGNEIFSVRERQLILIVIEELKNAFGQNNVKIVDSKGWNGKKVRG